MGPVNWLAVVLAAALAVIVGILWNTVLFPDRRQIARGDAERASGHVTMTVVFLISAAMLGHALARIGSETLAMKPWLYFMQSGGLAIAFVMPAVWVTHARSRTEPMRRVIDCAFWLVAYLAMGLVFWLLR